VPTAGEGPGLRARKKARTRAHIAGTAARLFGEHGYEKVSVADVAAAAEVSEQTVFNYFPTKRDLVLDRDDEVRSRLPERVRGRAEGISPAEAVRAEFDALVDDIAAMPVEQLRGSVGHLAGNSPEIRRLALESTDQLADALADAVVDTTPGVTRPRAKVHAIALAWVSQTLIDEAGARSREGYTAERIVTEVRPMVTAALDDLDVSFHAAYSAGAPAGA
jgi:AcrR family transcriptional regulator